MANIFKSIALPKSPWKNFLELSISETAYSDKKTMKCKYTGESQRTKSKTQIARLGFRSHAKWAVAKLRIMLKSLELGSTSLSR